MKVKENNKSKTIQRALCLECGDEKAGSLEACPGCDHTPEDLNDRAKHMLIATFEFDLAGLKAMQEALRDGQQPDFNPDSMMTITAALKADKPDAHWLLFWVFFGVPLFCVAVYIVYSLIEGGPAEAV